MFALLLSFASANIIERMQALHALEATSLTVTWSDCGGASAHGSVNSLTPASMTMGQTTTMTGEGTVDEKVTGGAFTMSLKAGFISQKFKGDVCKPATFQIKALGINVGTLSWGGLACPLEAGPAEVKMDVLLNANIPSTLASAKIELNASDENGASLLCLDVNTSS